MSVLTAERGTPRSYHALVRSTPWTTVLALAVLISYVDGFAMISLRGAVGFVSRAQSPFAVWLLHSTLQLPLFAVGVWGAFLLARRWRNRRAVFATSACVLVVTTLISMVITGVNAVYDYQLQVKEMTVMMSAGKMATGMQASMQESVAIQLVGLGVATVTFVVANLIVVGWVAAVCGGRLDRATAR